MSSSMTSVSYLSEGVPLRHSSFELLSGFDALNIVADSSTSQVFTQFVIHSWHLAHDIQNERIIVGGKKATDA